MDALSMLDLLKLISQHKSIREISKELQKSPSTIHKYIEELENDGMITKPNTRKARSIVLTKKGKEHLWITKVKE